MTKTYQNQAEWTKCHEATPEITEALFYLRKEIKDGCLAYGECVELQELADYIPLGDTELLEAAGVPEYPEDNPYITEELINIGEMLADNTKIMLGNIDLKWSDLDLSDQAIILTSLAREIGWDTPELWEQCKVQEEN